LAVKLLYKRILIMFSVALNIGFVIMAIFISYHHPKPFDERSWSDITGIVQRLQLPKARADALLDTIQQFRATVDRHQLDLRQARTDVIRSLAGNGAVDRDRLHLLLEAVSHQEKIGKEAFEAHVLDIRRQLGDEKGAEFFLLLLEHLENEDHRTQR
jgi:hypothetical protein